MRHIFRGIAIGLLAGTLFFFFPFVLGFLFFFLLISFIIRLTFGWGWRRRRFGAWHHHRYAPYPYDDNIISIDGRRYIPPVKEQDPERNFSVE